MRRTSNEHLHPHTFPFSFLANVLFFVLSFPLLFLFLRPGYGEERYETSEMQQRVAEAFRKIRERLTPKGGGGEREEEEGEEGKRDGKEAGEEMEEEDGLGAWVDVDAGQKIEAVHEEIWRHVSQVLERAGKAPIAIFKK